MEWKATAVQRRGIVGGDEGEEDDRRVSVSFPGRGTKKFIERYAQLQQL